MKKFMSVIFVAFVLGMGMAPLGAMPEGEFLTQAAKELAEEGDVQAAREADRTALAKFTSRGATAEKAKIGVQQEEFALQLSRERAAGGPKLQVSVKDRRAFFEGKKPGEAPPPYGAETGNGPVEPAPAYTTGLEAETGAESQPVTQKAVGGVGPRVEAGKPAPGEAEAGEGALRKDSGSEATAPKKLSRGQKLARAGVALGAAGLAGVGAYEIYEHNKPGTTSGQTAAKQAETGMTPETPETGGTQGTETIETPVEGGPQGGAVITPDETGMTPDETGMGITPDETGMGLTPGETAVIGMTPDETGTHGGKKPGKQTRAKTIHQAGKRGQNLTDLQKLERFSEQRVKPKAETVKEHGPKTRIVTEHPVEKRAIRKKEMGMRKTVKQEMSE